MYKLLDREKHQKTIFFLAPTRNLGVEGKLETLKLPPVKEDDNDGRLIKRWEDILTSVSFETKKSLFTPISLLVSTGATTT